MQVKIFAADDPAMLERQIQQWLHQSGAITIAGLVQSADEGQLVLTLFYTADPAPVPPAVPHAG